MTTSLWISPHLDDVAWSCAGELVRRCEAGETVVVCTVFAGGDPERRREDARALAEIGARHLHLDLDDGTARQRPPPSFRSLVLDPVPDPDLVARIVSVLRRVVGELGPTQVLHPLGVGGHVDHRAVFLASRSLPCTRYYEDRPYAFVPALAALRRLELEGGALADPPSAARIDAEVREGGCDALFEPGERTACIDVLARRLAARHPGLGLRLVPFTTVSSSVTRALALVGAYASQIAWLGVSERVAQLWAPDGGIVERYVRVEPSWSEL